MFSAVFVRLQLQVHRSKITNPFRLTMPKEPSSPYNAGLATAASSNVNRDRPAKLMNQRPLKLLEIIKKKMNRTAMAAPELYGNKIDKLVRFDQEYRSDSYVFVDVTQRHTSRTRKSARRWQWNCYREWAYLLKWSQLNLKPFSWTRTGSKILSLSTECPTKEER